MNRLFNSKYIQYILMRIKLEIKINNILAQSS